MRTLLDRVTTVFTPGSDERTEATNKSKEAAGRAGQATPAGQPKNDNYNTRSERLRGIGTPRRRDIRDVDGHESWRGVARQMHVDPDGHE